MGETLQQLKEQARVLSPAERLELVEDLLGNLQDFGGSFASEWAAEAEDRLAAFHSDELDTVSMEEVVGSTQRR
jgi:putative addiction module component (TIGR02574 family)